ncbi:MAG: segregation/condensation protein A [bacterium]|nr:segregation/condensation protein A [bacterium]
MLSVKVEQFEGPLDLLLQLITEKDLDITEISLAQVTEQYLVSIKNLASEIHVDELADFLVVASRLILIKSRALLPLLTPEEEEDIDLLARQLKIYKEFADAAKMLKEILSHGNVSFFKPVVRHARVSGFFPPPSVTAHTIADVCGQVIDRMEVRPPVRRIVIDPQINLQETISRLKSRLDQHASFQFQDLIRNAQSKTEVIVQFLAILELVKQQVAVISQTSISHDISIVSIS